MNGKAKYVIFLAVFYCLTPAEIIKDIVGGNSSKEINYTAGSRELIVNGHSDVMGSVNLDTLILTVQGASKVILTGDVKVVILKAVNGRSTVDLKGVYTEEAVCGEINGLSEITFLLLKKGSFEQVNGASKIYLVGGMEKRPATVVINDLEGHSKIYTKNVTVDVKKMGGLSSVEEMKNLGNKKERIQN